MTPKLKLFLGALALSIPLDQLTKEWILRSLSYSDEIPVVPGFFHITHVRNPGAAFGMLAARFDYPDILRRPTAEVLERFRAGGSGLVLLWWCFALTAVLFAPLVVLLSQAVADADPTLLAVATTVGVLAAIVQFLGLIRWPFVVPYLAREAADPAPPIIPSCSRSAAPAGSRALPRPRTAAT